MRGSGRFLAIVVAVLMLATACQSTGSGNASTPVGAQDKVSASSSVSGGEKLCGAPPCVRFLPRGETRTLADTLTDHPIASAVVLHAATAVLCGGVLCLLGEGVSYIYVDHAAKEARDEHACLKVSILPDQDKWKLVSLSASNERDCSD